MNKNPEAFNYILSKIPKLKNKTVLDIFAREGDWQSFNLNDKVKKIEAWEINKKFIPKLKKNLPNAEIKCHDSINYLNQKNKFDKFDIIIIDNPLNEYGKNYCEHFDVIKNIYKVSKKNSFVIFNVVLQPFNYKLFPKWELFRKSFYQKNKTNKLSIKFIKDFYSGIFEDQGLIVNSIDYKCRETNNNINYLFYFMFHLNK